jgi:hypothetical protein
MSYFIEADDIYTMVEANITDVLPFYIIFELFYYFSKKYIDFSGTYFILHFIVNLINTILLIPFILTMFTDPFAKYSQYDNWESLDYIYPLVIGLHTFHLVHHIKNIHYDEIIHHILTYIFWYVTWVNNNPIYIAPMITMSGIPGGITYLMLFLNKINKLSKLTEKKISMYINIWLRAPLCIIFSTILYIDNIKNNDYYYITLFSIIFTFINGVHFMKNIIDSYYQNYYNSIK